MENRTELLKVKGILLEQEYRIEMGITEDTRGTICIIEYFIKFSFKKFSAG